MKELGTIYDTSRQIIAGVTNIETGIFGHIGDHTLINVCDLILEKGAQINAGSVIAGGGDFHMGEFSTISYNCTILTGGDFGYVKNDYAPEFSRFIVRGSVKMGKNAFIGANSTITITPKQPHIVIGDNVVIMAGSYVDRSINSDRSYGRWGATVVEKPRVAYEDRHVMVNLKNGSA